MNKFKFKNKAGWVKFNYRKRFWVFGEKLYFITGAVRVDGCKRRTSVRYAERKNATDLYSVIKDMLVKEVEK